MFKNGFFAENAVEHARVLVDDRGIGDDVDNALKTVLQSMA